VSAIDIDLEDPETVGLWTAVGDLVQRLPGEWVPIGGLMVQLLAIEHGLIDVRPTVDIDLLGQALKFATDRPSERLVAARYWCRVSRRC
jgi:hypothetical protein